MKTKKYATKNLKNTLFIDDLKATCAGEVLYADTEPHPKKFDVNTVLCEFTDIQNDPIVKKMESEYPDTCAEYKRLSIEQYKLFLYKQNDYGPGNIAMGTSLSAEADIRLSLTGLIVRINDKVNRLINLVIKKNETPKNEPIEDAFKDLSVYAIIAQLVKNGKWAK